MKKINYLCWVASCWLLASGIAVKANPVSRNTAQTAAANFYSRNYPTIAPAITLFYTEFSAGGQPVYYVFNVNTNGGFVIVSADDAAHPILGYSDKGQYKLPDGNNNLGWWMNCRKQEIEMARNKEIAATPDITSEWSGYINNTSLISSRIRRAIPNVLPLVQSTWDQSPYYNAMCPGGAVTGCVATCMAQIMRYWQYPSSGHGISGYWDERAYSYQNNYGYLSADFDTSNYVWSAMPLSISSANGQIAKLMFDCGVSVDMDYSTESGAWVITGDYPVCAQEAFVKNFGYNPATIKGLYQSNYSIASWDSLVQNELNNNRPIEYVGWDSILNAGHTWVCDGYSSSNLYDMNWGWSGSDDGYFALNALGAGGYNFNWWNEALIGIEPPATSPYFVASPTFGCSGISVQFTDFSIANSAITSRMWLFPGGNPSTSTNTNPTVTYNTPGTYDVTEIVSNVNGTDTLVRKAYIAVASPLSTIPSENFQTTIFPPIGWVINNPNNYSYTWQLNTNTGGFGASTQSMYFNNCQGYQDWAPPGKAGLDIIGQRQQIYTPEYDYTSVTNPEIYFDVAYAPYNTTYSDTLAIYYSTDCGSTFTQVYSKGGTTLGTTGNYVTTGADTNTIGCFLPSSNNWRTDTIHIPAIAGISNVMFSFENRSGNGSPLYIDNINLPGVPTTIPVISTTPSTSIFPNPNSGQFTIAFVNISGNPYVKIYNVLGQEVYMTQLKNENTNINIGNQPNGVYIYHIFSENGSAISTGRLVKE